ncbi:hypothetical protein EGR_05379 [Echinococcus granulosus]|uniref:Uncharacterized protein n=1 Tax=Echinococcus granulosus TaxID=6210 RepID=W6V1L4_ECHGR|nr:hypothetical protein EGR_05379 [Echinococcus granulosus]EUB59759.1 hypothetical protein EGR_05379 [Echinococcus granulosus]
MLCEVKVVNCNETIVEGKGYHKLVIGNVYFLLQSLNTYFLPTKSVVAGSFSKFFIIVFTMCRVCVSNQLKPGLRLNY